MYAYNLGNTCKSAWRWGIILPNSQRDLGPRKGWETSRIWYMCYLFLVGIMPPSCRQANLDLVAQSLHTREQNVLKSSLRQQDQPTQEKGLWQRPESRRVIGNPDPRLPLPTHPRLWRFLICISSPRVYVKLIYRSQNTWLVALMKINADGLPHACYN